MMKRAAWILATWPYLAGVTLAAPPVEPIVGKYLADEGDHRIEIIVREWALYGRITWTRAPNLTDKQNEDHKLRGRRVIGIEHIRGFAKGRDGVWTGGTLYNPEDGNTYKAKLWLEGANRLIIQGRPAVTILGGILGALFGRIAYAREAAP